MSVNNTQYIVYGLPDYLEAMRKLYGFLSDAEKWEAARAVGVDAAGWPLRDDPDNDSGGA